MADPEPVELQPCEPGRLTPAELRTLFLFESLSDEQLEWLSAHGCTMRVPAGGLVLREGDPAEKFFVLLSGAVALSRRVGQDDGQTNRTEQRGVYMGATQAYLRDDGIPRRYLASMRALDDSEFFVLSAQDFGWLMREWFPMAIHLLEGLTLGMRSTQAAISERQRLMALGALSAGLMHELNNPAAAASRATGALRQRVAGMRHKLGMLAAGKVPPAQLDALVELQEDVIDYDHMLPQIPAHPAELNQVWTNLIDNAVQAMNGAGTLTIRTFRDDDHVVVSVGDTGPGVPKELRKRIFEPFFTTKPVGEGTGLGLDISYRIVMNGHGGDITVTSEPGDTRFLVRLPLREP